MGREGGGREGEGVEAKEGREGRGFLTSQNPLKYALVSTNRISRTVFEIYWDHDLDLLGSRDVMCFLLYRWSV